jgi:putative sterol carrier protein
MADMSLVKLFKGKLDENTMTNEDLPLFLELICQIGNENEDMRREVEDWDKVTQIIVMETSIACWLQTKGGKYSCGNGEHANPELTFKVKAGVAKDIFTGALDANRAYMDGSLFLVGSPMDAARFRTMRELVREIFNDITVPAGTPDYVEKAAPAGTPKAAAKPAKGPAKKVAKKAAKKAGKK